MGLLVTFNPLESHGIVGQDGYLGLRHSTCDSIGHPTLSHPVPWHSGTGWSLGMSVGHSTYQSALNPLSTKDMFSRYKNTCR